MFSYYGSKSIVVDLYPPPAYGKIIEPFAGSARYALKYFDREVTLVDKYEVVIKVWRYLQKCSPKDILGLPTLTKGLDLRTCNLSEEERLFLSMMAGVSGVAPRNKVSPFVAEQNGRKNRMHNVANNLFKIKHWVLVHGDYKEIINEYATWFIDAPYQSGGYAYVENKINFQDLSLWCKQRWGHTIVCENTKADWMEFKPMKSMRGGNQLFTTEAIWSNQPTAFDWQQQELFKL